MTGKDGTGRLFDDVFADSRLLAMPPSVCALLVLMCRNHNVRRPTRILPAYMPTHYSQYIAEKILAINERNTYHAPDKLSDADRHSQDEELFQRARLVNCGFFMQIILGDYVGAILGLVRDGYSWRLKILDVRSPILSLSRARCAGADAARRATARSSTTSRRAARATSCPSSSTSCTAGTPRSRRRTRSGRRTASGSSSRARTSARCVPARRCRC